MPKAKIRVLVAEDDELHRESICAMINGADDMKVIQQAADGDEAVQFARQLKPDIILLDIMMPPGIDGIEVIRQVRKFNKSAKILALTHDELAILAVRREGGNGYVPKNKRRMILPAIRELMEGTKEMFIEPTTDFDLEALIELVQRARLTESEEKILGLIVYTNKEIARRVGKTERRVRAHLSGMYEKLNIRNGEQISKRRQAEAISRLMRYLEMPKGPIRKSYEH